MTMFKPGERVKLRSGDVVMMVKAINRDTVNTSWLDDKGRRQESTFLRIQLEALPEKLSSPGPVCSK